MEAELVEVFQLASKAADAAAVNGKGEGVGEERQCIDALERLKSFPVTSQVLVSTQVCPFSSSLYSNFTCLARLAAQFDSVHARARLSSFLCYHHGSVIS